MTGRRAMPALSLAALALSALLAGCSSSGSSDLGRIAELAKQSILPSEPLPPPVELTRAELNQIPYATIALSLDGGPRSYLVPLADNGGYLTYLDANRRGLVMLGGAVTGTRALGQDLRGVRHDPRDPIAFPKPLAGWPAELFRDYQYAVRDGAFYRVTLGCSFQRVAAETVEIAEIDFDLVRVGETCTNAARQVTNTYWVEEDTGFIWKSVQWLGPELGQATVEIIRPYGG